MAIDLKLTEKTLTSSDGTPIYAVAAGNPANNAIVFVHGYALTAGVWDGILKDERLLEEFYLVNGYLSALMQHSSHRTGRLRSTRVRSQRQT